jgi:uncharacterized protein (TIGR03790 family)
MRKFTNVGWLAAAALALVVGSASSSAAQTAANVAVVINENNPDSIRIGEHYVTRRSIPPANVIRVSVPAADTIDRAAYTTAIEAPIARALASSGLQDRVLYIVLTKGVPLRITGTGGQQGTSASVDSELTLLYRRMTGRPVPPAGTIDNPYFSEAPGQAAVPFDRRNHDIYLVTRLDGLSADDVIQLIDRGIGPAPNGGIVFDQRGDARAAVADRWMTEAAEAIKAVAADLPIAVEPTLRPADVTSTTFGYFSWGTADPALRAVELSFPLSAGSIAATLGGTDAATFTEGEKAPRPFAGHLIRAGATGVGANVAEPYLRSSIRPQVLFPAYLGGLSLADAFYRALPHLGWQAVVIGDPLVRPFGKPVPLAELDAPPDAVTTLPPVFSTRRLEVLRADFPRVSAEALELTIASESHQARGDRANAITALSEATELAPDSATLHIRLAALHEEAGDYQRAVAGYRKVLELQPRNPIALNNLAYRLGTAGGDLTEALELARRAHTLVPADGTIADTLGWIEHLSGNRQEAVKLLRQAAERVPGNAEVRLHAAIVLAEAGAVAEARKHLEAALKLDPALETRDDVRKLQETLRNGR